MAKAKIRVQLGDFVGTVTKKHTITFCDEKAVVYDVKWDGNPSGIPMKWKDEAGTRKAGYSANKLTFI